MVDPDVVLIIRILIRSRANPVGVRVVGRIAYVFVRKWIVLHQFERNRIDQVTGPGWELVGGSIQYRAAWTCVSSDIVKRNKARPHGAASISTVDAGVGIPKLPARCRTQARSVKASSGVPA